MVMGDPRLRAVQEGGQYDGSVSADLCAVLQVFVVPDSFVQSAESTVCFCKSVVNLLVDLNI